MTGKLRLGVLFGGRSGEHEVSLMSARSVLSVLDPMKYEVTPIGITQEGVWLTGTNTNGEDTLDAIRSNRLQGLTRVTLLPEAGQSVLYAIGNDQNGQRLSALTELDVIFPMLHGTFGEDGTVQGLLELADIAYVGAGVLGSAAGMDKALFKDVMRAHNLPVVESIVTTRAEIAGDLEGVIAKAEAVSPYPLFTKPANLGSSVGITKCYNRSDLYEGLMEAAAYDRRVLIERGLQKPREIEVSVLGNDNPQASVAGEVRPAADYYTYEAKYLDDRSELIIPANLPEELMQRIRQIAIEAYSAIDCSGMARVDFLLDSNTQAIYISEVNTIPGFTPISMYPKLWETSGLPYAALVDRLIELALERKADRDRTERQFRRRR
ncbi:MAG: D-alanine--D-alanine ligase [Chloroflexi bacterium]|nr:D-alanine--D-alanine ligase [Chloroflexota bacterium]